MKNINVEGNGFLVANSLIFILIQMLAPNVIQLQKQVTLVNKRHKLGWLFQFFLGASP